MSEPEDNKLGKDDTTGIPIGQQQLFTLDGSGLLVPVGPDNPLLSLDYSTAVSRGDIPGVTSQAVSGADDVLGNTQKTIWGAAGRYPFQTAAVSLELLSGSINDAVAGTGAQSVFISGLDTNHVEQTETVIPTGTTPIALVNSYISINQSTVINVGALKTNDGDITIRVPGPGDIQSVIKATVSNSQDGAFTVPAGKQFVIKQFVTSADRGNDALFKVYEGLFGGAFQQFPPIPVFQNSIVLPLDTPIIVAEKSNIDLTGIATGAGNTVFISVRGYLESNA